MRVVEIKAVRDILLRLCDGRPIPHAVTLADDKIPIRVFMNGMWWLDSVRVVDKENQVDPAAVLGADGQVGGDRGSIKQQWLRILVFQFIAAVAKGPKIGRVEMGDCENEGSSDLVRCRRSLYREGDYLGFVEVGCIRSCQIRNNVDIRLGRRRGLACIQRGIGKDGSGIDDLIDTGVHQPDGIVSCWLVQWHEDRVSTAR